MEAVAASRSRRWAAWGVHLYTALGLPLALLATAALFRGDVRTFFLILCAAVFVDATDGTLARKVKVREVLPEFDGRRLDDIIDFITFSFLPALAFAEMHLFPEGYELAAVAPLMASGYGFCQERAKTEESFVGFPSYWNIGLVYLVLLETSQTANLVIVLFFSVLVFVPIHYVYPTKTKLLRPITVGAGYLWALCMVALTLNIGASWAKTGAYASLVYPVYYFVLSGIHHLRVHRDQAGGEPSAGPM